MKLVEVKEGDRVVVLEPKDVVVAMEATDVAIVIKQSEDHNIEVHTGKDVDPNEETAQNSLVILVLSIINNAQLASELIEKLAKPAPEEPEDSPE